MNLEESLKAALDIKSPEDIGVESFDDLGKLSSENDEIILEGEKVLVFDFDVDKMRNTIKTTLMFFNMI